MATSAIALVVAALVMGAAHFVLGARPASAQRLGFNLTADTSTFTITSNIYDSPACAGSTALLYPGTTRCMVFTVKNNLTAPIIVQNLSVSVTSSPAGCPASDFSLPVFNGDVTVPAKGTAVTAGLPISLRDSGSSQDACQGRTISFAYTGSAQFTDATSTVLTSTPATPIAGQPTTLHATVAGANAAGDASLPAGTVTFMSCPTTDCASTTSLGAAAVGSGGIATLTTSGLSMGTHYIVAAYGGSGTDYSASTSPMVTLVVAAPTTSAGTTPTGSGSSSGGAKTSASGSSSPIAFTGADIAGMAGAALILIAAGTVLVVVVRRRRRVPQS
jgi:hypothetical protein